MAEYKWGRVAKPQTHTATAKPAAKKQPTKPAKRKPKPKPVPYLVTLHNGTQLQTHDKATGFHSGLLKDGFHHEGAWYPPTAILRVERRDA